MVALILTTQLIQTVVRLTHFLSIQTLKRPVKIPQEFLMVKKLLICGQTVTKKCFSTLLTKMVTYGSGVQSVHGCGGVGSNSHSSEGTYYYYIPRRVEVNWNMYGGMKLLQHWSYSSQSHAGTWVLDGEGTYGTQVIQQTAKLQVSMVITQLDIFHNSKEQTSI